MLNNSIYACSSGNTSLDFPLQEMGLMIEKMDKEWNKLVVNGKKILKSYLDKELLFRLQ